MLFSTVAGLADATRPPSLLKGTDGNVRAHSFEIETCRVDKVLQQRPSLYGKQVVQGLLARTQLQRLQTAFFPLQEQQG